MDKNHSILRALRVIAGSALIGTVVAGALFGWLPAIAGVITVHEIGAVLGAGVGVVANSRHMI